MFSAFILWLKKLALNSTREGGVLSPDVNEIVFSFEIFHLSLVDCVYVCFPRFLHCSTARTWNRSKSLCSSRWQRCTYLLLTNMKIRRKLKKNTWETPPYQCSERYLQKQRMKFGYEAKRWIHKNLIKSAWYNYTWGAVKIS